MLTKRFVLLILSIADAINFMNRTIFHTLNIGVEPSSIKIGLIYLVDSSKLAKQFKFLILDSLLTESLTQSDGFMRCFPIEEIPVVDQMPSFRLH